MLDYISTSIRRKLTFVMLGTAVVALLVTATAMIIYEARTYHQTWVDDLVTQAEIIGKTSAPALSFDDPKAARENLAVLRLRPLVTAAAIYTADGRLFADYTTAADVPLSLPATTDRNGYRIEGDQLWVFQEVRENGQFLGTVYLRAAYELWNRLLGYLVIVGIVDSGESCSHAGGIGMVAARDHRTGARRSARRAAGDAATRLQTARTQDQLR